MYLYTDMGGVTRINMTRYWTVVRLKEHITLISH